MQSLLAVHGPGLPALLAERTLAFRAYSGDHKMQSARVVHGGEPEQAAAELPALPDRPRLIGSWRAGPYWPASDSGW